MNNTLFNTPYISDVALLEKLALQSPNEFQQVLKNLQISGQLQSLPNNVGYGYGGRIGYTIPSEAGLFRLGVTGGGVTLPGFSQSQVSGGDIGYSTKDKDISVSYQKQSEYGPDLIRLLFKQYF